MSPNRLTQRYWSNQKAFTLVELLVILVVIGVLAGIIIPALNRARLKASASQCVDQHRQLGEAFAGYVADQQSSEVLQKVAGARQSRWEHKLRLHAGQEHGWQCPDCRQGHLGVGFNQAIGTLSNLSHVKNPALTVAFGDTGLVANPEHRDPNRWVEQRSAKGFNGASVFEVPTSVSWNSTPMRMVNRHLGRASAVFADGHVEALPVGVIGFQYEAGHARALWDHQ